MDDWPSNEKTLIVPTFFRQALFNPSAGGLGLFILKHHDQVRASQPPFRPLHEFQGCRDSVAMMRRTVAVGRVNKAAPASRRPQAARAFSTSSAMSLTSSYCRRADSRNAQPVRRNPLIGNYNPVQSPKQPVKKAPPSNTQTPVFSRPPQPRFRPGSSTEVAPNGDMPPPPPPPPLQDSSAQAGAAVDTAREKTRYAYDAAAPGRTFDPGMLDITSIVANKIVAINRETGIGDPTQLPTVRSKAATGRTVFVGLHPQLASHTAPTPMMALRTLNRLVSEQHIRAKAHSQRFHERKGMKRKRLRSERWRARFKDGFKAACTRVYQLKKQGW